LRPTSDINRQVKSDADARVLAAETAQYAAVTAAAAATAERAEAQEGADYKVQVAEAVAAQLRAEADAKTAEAAVALQAGTVWTHMLADGS
jgi:hypothetical protein